MENPTLIPEFENTLLQPTWIHEHRDRIRAAPGMRPGRDPL